MNRRLHLRYILAIHLTQNPADEKILGLHYRHFETFTPCFYTPFPTFNPEKLQYSVRVEKVRLGAPVPLTLRCIKHRYIEEPILSLEFLGEGERFIFLDVTAEREEELEESRQELFQKVQGVIGNLERTEGPPNQSKILKAMKENLNIGKNTGLKLLSRGGGTYWKSEPREGSRLYQTLSPFPHTIRGGKEESLQRDPWDSEALI